MKDEVTMEAIIGPSAKHVKTELGWLVVTGVLRHMKIRHPDVLLTDDTAQLIAEHGDKLHALEEGMSREEREINDMESRIQEVIRYCLLEICQVNPMVFPYLSDSSCGGDCDSDDDEAGSKEKESDDAVEVEQDVQFFGTRLQYRQQLNTKASAAQERQAVTVNRKRGESYKEVLEEDDVCLVSVHHKVRGATDKKSFAVLITKVILR